MDILNQVRAFSSESPDLQITENIYNYIYLDSEVNTEQSDKANIVLSSSTSSNNYASILLASPKRIAVSSLQISSLFNINPRNNEIRFRVNGLAFIYSVNVVPGVYNTPAEIIAAIVAALNTITGTTGATFASAADPNTNSDSRFNLTCNLTFNFDLTSPALKYGKQLWNLPTSQTFTTSKIVGPILGYYTRYIDFMVDELLQYQTNLARTNSKTGGGNNLIRLFLPPITLNQATGNLERYTNIIVPTVQSWFKFEEKRTISSISFRLLDEFGQSVYSGNNPDAPEESAFKWSLTLIAQF